MGGIFEEAEAGREEVRICEDIGIYTSGLCLCGRARVDRCMRVNERKRGRADVYIYTGRLLGVWVGRYVSGEG